MKFTKNMAVLLLVLCMALSLCACSPKDSSMETIEAAGEETEPVDTGLTTYTIRVVDEEGNPISGAMVQICLDACYPGVTNESGVAQFSVQEADYKVSFLSLPAGFANSTEEENFYFQDGSTEMTIILKTAG